MEHPYKQTLIEIWELYKQSKVLMTVDYSQHMELRKQLGLPDYNHNCHGCRKNAVEETYKKLQSDTAFTG